MDEQTTPPTSTRSSGRRALVAALLVTTVLLVAEIGVRLIEEQLPPASFGDGEELAIKRDQLAAMRDAGNIPQVVFVGASAVDAGVDPVTFDEASRTFDVSYNASGVAMPIEFIVPWMERIVLPRARPLVAVVGVLPFQLGDFGTQVGGTENVDGYRLAYAASLKELEPGTLGEIEDAISDVSYLVRYRHQLRDPSEVVRAIGATITGDDPKWAAAKDEALRTRAEWEGFVSDRGANELYAAVPEAPLLDEAMAARYTAWIESGADTRELRSMLEGLQALDLDVVLFAPPLDRVTLEASGLDFALLDEAVDLMEREATRFGIPFIDLFRAQYDPLDFHDKVHLNRVGAQRVAADLAARIDALCETGELPSCAR